MSDPLHALQAAARLYGQHMAPGMTIRVCKLYDEHGRKVAQILVPSPSESATADDAANASGWDFSRATPRFNGVEVPIYGKPQALLQILATATGPVTGQELNSAWKDYTPGESTIRGHIAELRAKLKTIFPLWEEQINYKPKAGYELAIR